ncbi:transcriptional regulator [Streptosporangium sp. KLBMP 9127]|nr:transcriptional regulator [Streptosporangium sp. KLBMP 9127]
MDNRPAWVNRLRNERRRRLWTQREMAKELAEAADEHTRARLPARDSLIRMIKDWEAGRHKPKDPYPVLYSRVFGMDEDALFAMSPDCADDDDVLRREFLGVSAAATGLALASAPLAQLSRGRRVNRELVEHLRRRIARLRRLDDILGGADTYQLYLAELDTTSTVLDQSTYSDETGRALLGMAAEQAQQAGWAAFDAGWHPEARRLFKHSLSAATDAGDTSLLANSLAFLAYLKVSTGQPGAKEADAACRIADHETPPAVRTLLYERAAWAHALAEQQREMEAALAKAAAALGEHGSQPDPDWAMWVDQTELQIMTGRCWSVLHRPSRAVPALEHALATFDDTHARDKALYLTWLAEAHLDGGEVEQAAAVLGRSVQLAVDVASIRPRQRIHAVLQRLERHASLPFVAEVRERAAMLSSVPASPGMQSIRRQSR